MPLDPPITAEEEDLIRRVRAMQAKQAEIADAEAKKAQADAQAQSARAGYENLRREFAETMGERGITNPDALLRRRDR